MLRIRASDKGSIEAPIHALNERPVLAVCSCCCLPEVVVICLSVFGDVKFDDDDDNWLLMNLELKSFESFEERSCRNIFHTFPFEI